MFAEIETKILKFMDIVQIDWEDEIISIEILRLFSKFAMLTFRTFFTAFKSRVVAHTHHPHFYG